MYRSYSNNDKLHRHIHIFIKQQDTLGGKVAKLLFIWPLFMKLTYKFIDEKTKRFREIKN